MVLTLIVLATCLIVGVVLLALGLRGRRIGEHPHCPRCNFDLHGVVDVAPGGALPQQRVQCTDCGKVFARSSLRRGERRRRRRLLVAGATMLVIALPPAGFLTWSMVAGPNAASVKPIGWLELEARYAPRAIQDAAAQELLKRHAAGVWSDEALRRLALHILATQQPPSSWSNESVQVLMTAQAQQALPLEDLARAYFAYAEWVLEFKQRVRCGQPLALRTGVRTRDGMTPSPFSGPGAFLDMLRLHARVEPGEHDLAVVDASGHVVMRLLRDVTMEQMLASTSSLLQTQVPLSLPPGTYRIQGAIELRISQRRAGEMNVSSFGMAAHHTAAIAPPSGADVRPSVAWPVRIDQPLEVVGADGRIVNVVRSEKLDARVRATFARAKLITWGGESGEPQRRARLYIRGEGTAELYEYYSVEVEEDLGGRAGPVRRWDQLNKGARSTEKAGSGIAVSWLLEGAWMLPDPLVMPIRAARLRVRLTPSLERAEQSFGIPHAAGAPLPEISGLSVVITNLDVERRAAQDADESLMIPDF